MMPPNELYCFTQNSRRLLWHSEAYGCFFGRAIHEGTVIRVSEQEGLQRRVRLLLQERCRL